MFNANISRIFSLLTAVKYVQNKPSTYDYTTSPRPCHNFMFMLSGSGEIVTEENVISVNKGDFVFIPKDTTYLSKWTEKTEFLSIHFNYVPNLDPLLNAIIPIQKIVLEDFWSTLELANTLLKYQFSKNEKSFLVLSSFNEICSDAFSKVIIKQLTDTTSVSPAIEYIIKHYREKISIEELASLCYLSPSRFYFLFKKQTGYSPIVYKNRVCIFEACGSLLVDKNKSIEEISIEYGFESAVYFRRLFKAITGKTPTQYREQETLL